MRFLCDDQALNGPEIDSQWDRIPAITHVRYHNSDRIIEVSHVIGFMGENYVETRCRHKDVRGEGGWIQLGSNTTRTAYQLRRALDLQAQAVCSYLGLE
jgi:hypothetical protein